MPAFLAWSGWVMTLLFGLLSLYQFIQSHRDKAIRDAQRDHLKALRTSLQALRANFVEAINTGEAVKSDAARQWVRAMAYHVLGMEAHVDAALGTQETGVPSSVAGNAVPAQAASLPPPPDETRGQMPA